MDKTLQYRIKEVYGIPRMYPVNDIAQIIAALAGVKTLNDTQLKLAAKLGFNHERIM